MERSDSSARNAVHLDFDRNGDQALDFLGGVAGPLRDEFDVRRRKIRIGVDGQLLEGPRAPAHQGQGGDDDQEGLLEGEGDESGDHTIWPLLDTVGELHEEAAVGQHALALLQAAGDRDHAVLLRARW